jgi:uncharacterized delta-60 repeat protein
MITLVVAMLTIATIIAKDILNHNNYSLKTVNMRLISILAFLLFSIYTFSQPGTLDSSFGVNGKIVTSFPNGYFNPTKAAIQQDGKIISGGIGGFGMHTDSSDGFAAIKYNFDGTLDSSFGIDGEAVYHFKHFYGGCGAIASQNDNKIILAGWGGESRSGDHANDSVLLTRLNADGNVDVTFGNLGEVITSVGAAPFINCLIVQPDGKIVAAGQRASDFLIMRFTTEGLPDLSFGGKGYVYTHLSGVAGVSALALQPDGKILAAGNTADNAVLARYMPNGTLDSAFAANGILLQKFQNEFPVYRDVALTNDGNIIATGSVGGALSNMLVAKYNLAGHLDETFGTNGIAVLNTGKFQSEALSVIIQNDKKIIISGSAFKTFSSGSEEFAMWRLTESGAADSSFGVNGETTTDFGSEYLEYAIGSFEKFNKVFTMGAVGTDISGEFPTLLARYNNDDESKKQILITKIRHCIQHHNGITWDYNNNISSYAVQRSFDGIHFSSIARISVGNNSNYTFADPSPLSGNNYYRLQTTSLTGTVNYSNVIAVTNTDIKISPNPATNTLHIEGLSNQKVQLSVVDFRGNVKLQTTVKSSIYNLNIASLKPGNYLLKIQSQDDVVTKSFVKE